MLERHTCSIKHTILCDTKAIVHGAETVLHDAGTILHDADNILCDVDTTVIGIWKTKFCMMMFYPLYPTSVIDMVAVFHQ